MLVLSINLLAGKGEVIEGWDVGLEGSHFDTVALFFSISSFCIYSFIGIRECL